MVTRDAFNRSPPATSAFRVAQAVVAVGDVVPVALDRPVFLTGCPTANVRAAQHAVPGRLGICMEIPICQLVILDLRVEDRKPFVLTCPSLINQKSSILFS